MLKRMTVIISNICNSRCRDCYITSNHFPKNVLDEKSINLIKKCMRQYGPVEHFAVSGGEPTLHLKELDLLLRDTEMMKSKVLTNAWWGKTHHEADRILEVFLKNRLQTLHISCGQEHQKYVSLDSVMKAAEFALETKSVKEVVISYELVHPTQQSEILKIFKDLVCLYPDQIRFVTGYWNALGAGGTRKAGQDCANRKQNTWCEFLETSNLTIDYNGYAFRCCGGAIMQDHLNYGVGTLKEDGVVCPFARDDHHAERFKRLEKQGMQFFASCHDRDATFSTQFKCEQCRKIMSDIDQLLVSQQSKLIKEQGHAP